MSKKRPMTLQDACALVDDNLSDGAYWAMAHELAGAEYGEVWHELDGYPKSASKVKCDICGKKVKSAGINDHKRDAHKS